MKTIQVHKATISVMETKFIWKAALLIYLIGPSEGMHTEFPEFLEFGHRCVAKVLGNTFWMGSFGKWKRVAYKN